MRRPLFYLAVTTIYALGVFAGYVTGYDTAKRHATVTGQGTAVGGNGGDVFWNIPGQPATSGGTGGTVTECHDVPNSVGRYCVTIVPFGSTGNSKP